MAQWLEISLSVDGEAAEAAAELLNRFGYQGVAVEHEGIPPDKLDEDEIPPAPRMTVRAYLPNDDTVDEMKAQVEQGLRYLNMMYPMPEPQYKLVREEDWAEAWKVHYHPVRIGKRLFIRPQWVEIEIPEGAVEIALDPGMAFGTGTHPTTQLCLEALEAYVQPGQSILDLGTGSAILAMAAAKLGAGFVLGLDVDPVAVDVARKNVTESGLDGTITIDEGSLENVLHSPRRFDMIVVNILARVIVQMCDQNLGDVVRPGGLAIFSGIIQNQAEEVEEALHRTGLTPYHRRVQGDWVMIEARRPHLDP
ncbi:MAG: 50S ribosomal protein L11 methyltransferase [bacterium]|nr:50S ribosomal protein L11 methyltransferase [bacterium]